MNLPTSTVITGMDSMARLEQALEAVRTFKPMPQAAIDQLLARTAESALEGKHEKFKTSTAFDGTVRNPQWLGLDA